MPKKTHTGARPPIVNQANPPGAELEFSSSRLGLDLDVIRYPFFRFGIDYDYYVNHLKFLDANGARYTGVPPYDFGISRQGDSRSHP